VKNNENKNGNANYGAVPDNIKIVNSLAGIIPDNYTLEEVRCERLSKQ